MCQNSTTSSHLMFCVTYWFLPKPEKGLWRIYRKFAHDLVWELQVFLSLPSGTQETTVVWNIYVQWKGLQSIRMTTITDEENYLNYTRIKELLLPFCMAIHWILSFVCTRDQTHVLGDRSCDYHVAVYYKMHILILDVILRQYLSLAAHTF